jgi:hypothetical protein
MKIVKIVFLSSLFTVSALAQQRLADNQIKKNVTPLSGSLNYINTLQPVTYNYNNQEFKHLNLPTGVQYGFLADNVQSVLPGLVTTTNKFYPAGKNNYRTAAVENVDMQSLVPILLGAIKEQQQQIDSLKAELKALKK